MRRLLTFLRLVCFEVSIGDYSCGFAALDCYYADNGLFNVSSCMIIHVAIELTWTASRKKLRLKLGNARMYLLATVIIIEDAQ